MSTVKLKKIEETFSGRLKMLRKERGWSQEDLATKLDVSPGSVGNWEIGPYEPHAKTLKTLAALFDVDVRYLLYGEKGGSLTVIREPSPEYKTVNLAELLREVEEARDRLDQIAQQLRRAMTPSGGASVLTETASASYDLKRSGVEKIRAKEGTDVEAQQTSARTETHRSK
ncbi:MAG TPA: helix-turn-helix transcriptional regulator [Pseudomonadales bacterium]|nr:helix-turn-helix transcriptional regulator [Pseudomonadales bacterium]